MKSIDTQKSNSHDSSDVLAELQSQREIIEEHTKVLRSIKRSMKISAVFSVLKFLVIAVPLIIALIYLPPLFKEFMASFQDLQTNAQNLGIPAGFDFTELQDLIQAFGSFGG